MAGSRMEVDPPTTISMSMSTGPPLKRSNSAPMINILTSVCPRSPVHRRPEFGSFSSIPQTCGTTCSTTSSLSINHISSPSSLSKSGDSARIRRYSASCSVGLHSPTAALKTQYRLDQIKNEERIHVAEREAAHEKDVHSAMQMSISVDDLSLDESITGQPKRPANFSEPLHVMTPPYQLSSSPSPTRLAKQCFSPSLQAAVSGGIGKTPSPMKKSVSSRRSGSPMSFRPSPLSIKRKLVSGGDFDDPESYLSPPKRPHYHIPGNSTPEHLTTAINYPLIHCISSSSPSESGSPEQQVPNMTQTGAGGSPAYNLPGGIGSSSSAFMFRPVRPATEPSLTHPHDNHVSMATHDLDRESNHSNLDRESNHSDAGLTLIDRDSNHSDILNVSMDASPDTTFSPGAGRPTQV